MSEILIWVVVIAVLIYVFGGRSKLSNKQDDDDGDNGLDTLVVDDEID